MKYVLLVAFMSVCNFLYADVETDPIITVIGKWQIHYNQESKTCTGVYDYNYSILVTDSLKVRISDKSAVTLEYPLTTYSRPLTDTELLYGYAILTDSELSSTLISQSVTINGQVVDTTHLSLVINRIQTSCYWK
jgi:hypothetical protein